MRKIVLAGGSGYVGNLIINYFVNDEIFILSRNNKHKVFINDKRVRFIYWDGKSAGNWFSVLENADVLINLAGKNINCRFSESNKDVLLSSRVDSTTILGKAIEQCTNPPKMWLNASSVAYFNDSVSEIYSEYSKNDLGDDFLSLLTQEWESTFNKFANDITIKSIFRISLIMGDSKGSAMNVLKKIVKFGGGGRAGSGKQMVSWISENDFVKALSFLIDNELSGAFNFSNTNPLTNEELMRQLRLKYNVPFGLPAPEILIKLSSYLTNTPPDLVLRSQNVYPQRLIDNGFKFNDLDIINV